MTLACALLLSACNSDKNDRDRDDEEETESETVEETAETSAAAPLPSEEEVQSAFMDVLSEYSARIISYEQCGYNISYPSINYSDINGDGINELIFTYDSTADQEEDVSDYPDGIFANTAVYMYNTETHGADCLFDEMTYTNIGAWGMEADLVMLDDGNILRANMNGRMGYYTETYDEYQFNGTSYERINSWQLDMSIPDDQWELPAEQRTVNPDDAMNGTESVPVDDFFAAQQDYISRIECPLMPSVERFYSNDFSVESILGGDWCGIPNSVFGQGNYMVYSMFAALASGGSVQPAVPVAPDQIDETQMNAAYLAILAQYETELRIVEDVEYGAMPSVSLADITGDGVNELIIEYCADQENGWGSGESNYYMSANIKIFTYDPVAGEAFEMRTIQNAVMNAAGGFYTDIIVLDDGTIMIESNGGDEDWSYYYDVFEVQGYSLVQVSELEIYSWPDDDYNYQSEYTYNGEQITEEQSDALIAQYISQMSYAVTWNQYYDSEWYESGDWAETVMSLPSNHISYDEAVAQLS